MASRARVSLGVAFVAASVVVAALGFGGAAARVEPDPGRQVALSITRDLEEAWKTQRRAALTAAASAAGLGPLRSALSNGVDANRLVELFASEGWWREMREEFPIVRVVRGAELVTFGKPALGAEDRDLVVAAQGGQAGVAIAPVKDALLLLAATQVDLGAGKSVVLVLGRRFDDGLRVMAERVGAAVGISNGRAILASAGAASPAGFVRTLVGREGEGGVVDPERGFVAGAVRLAPRTWLWGARIAQLPAASPRVDRRHVFWGGAGALVVVGLLLSLGGRRAGAPAAPLPTERTPPLGTPAPVLSAPTPRLGSDGGGPAPDAAAAEPQAEPEPEPPLPVPVGAPPARGPLAERPDTFGRYKLLDLLGGGGMSEVYLAVAFGAEGFTRRFAIKRLRPELAVDATSVAQFIDEARLQASLVHSNIVPVFDFGTVDGEYFMTEEYIIGRDLLRITEASIAKHGRPLDPHFVYYIAYETLQALDYAHNKRDSQGRDLGIVHRDVSAMNIMVSASGEVKLFDFGIAKANRRATKTQVGMVKGNANFMSPEQARGQSVDGRSDLFSLGLVMHFCLTNTLLYNGDNDLDILFRAACGPTTEDLEMIALLPAPADRIIARALAMDPAHRYANAQEFALDLAPFVTNRKTEMAHLMAQLFGDELAKEAADAA